MSIVLLFHYCGENCFIMTLPASYFETIPSFIRPLFSSGLMVGIIIITYSREYRIYLNGIATEKTEKIQSESENMAS